MKNILTAINVLCAFMHIGFENFICDKSGEYTSFILVENMLVTLFFLLMAFIVYFAHKEKKCVLINLLFWIFFEINVLVFRPEKTTLEIIQSQVQIQQWVLLSVFGLIVIILNIVEYLRRLKKA